MQVPHRMTRLAAHDRTVGCAVAARVGADRRAAPRKAMCVPGLLRLVERHEPICCKVVDFSATGARVVLAGEQGLVNWEPSRAPAELTLVMRMDRTEADCKVAWLNENQIGLRFRSALRHTHPQVQPAGRQRVS